MPVGALAEALSWKGDVAPQARFDAKARTKSLQPSDGHPVDMEALSSSEEVPQQVQELQRCCLDLQERLRRASEESAMKSSHLQQQIVSAAQGELQACQRVEEGLEKNRQLVRQNEQLRGKVNACSEAEFQARHASEEWKSQNQKLELQCETLRTQVGTASSSSSRPACAVDDELFVMEQFKLEQDEERLRALVSTASAAERQACHVASAELFKLRCECEDLRQRMADAASREQRGTLQNRPSDESHKVQHAERRCDLLQSECSKLKADMAALVEEQHAARHIGEPEIEKSPQLNAELCCGRDVLPDFGSTAALGSMAASTIARWEERISEEVNARQLVESRLQAAVTGLEQLRPEYERFREHAVKAVDAERESQKRTEELSRKNQDLQRECEDLQVQRKRGEDLQRECDELRKKLSATEHRHLQRECKELRKKRDAPIRDIEVDELAKIKLLKHECGDLRLQVASAIEVESDVAKLVGQLREQLANASRKEKTAQGLSEERLRSCERLELKCEELAKKAKVTARTAPLLEDASAEAFLRCEELERECAHLQAKLQASASAATSAQPLLADVASLQEEDLELQLWSCIEDGLRHNQAERNLGRDCGRLHRELEVATYAEMDALRCAESRLLENEELRSELEEQREQISRHAQSAADSRGAFQDDCTRLRQELQDASHAETDARRCADSRLELNERLRFEVEELRLQFKTQELAEQDTLGTCETLRKQVCLSAEVNQVNEQLRSEVQEYRLQIKRQELAERDARSTCESLQKQACVSAEETKVLSRELRAMSEQAAQTAKAEQLQLAAAKAASQELDEMRAQARRSAEAERTARRSADAATELLRRKEELRRVKQVKEEAERSVEALRSAEVTVGLKRLIHDLGHGHGDANGLAQLSISPPGTASEAMPTLGAVPTKALKLPGFGI